MKSSISVKIGTTRRGQVYAVIGPRRRYSKTVVVNGVTQQRVPSRTIHLVVGGTRAHSLRKGAKLAKDKAGQQKGRVHPGTKPNDFLNDAMGAATEEYISELQRVIEEELAILAGKVKRG
jgi:hypothetical protein